MNCWNHRTRAASSPTSKRRGTPLSYRSTLIMSGSGTTTSSVSCCSVGCRRGIPSARGRWNAGRVSSWSGPAISTARSSTPSTPATPITPATSSSSTPWRWSSAGDVERLGRWLTLLGPGAPSRSTSAALATAWFGLATADHTLVVSAIGAALSGGDEGPLADGSPSLAVAVAALRSMAGPDGVPGVLADTETVRNGGGPFVNPWWGFATLARGTAQSMLGDLPGARASLTDSLAVIAGSPAFESCNLAHLALLDFYEGDFVSANRRASRALAIADRHHLDGVVPAISAFAVGAFLAARNRRFDDARAAVAATCEMEARIGELSPRTSLLCNLLLARTYLALGAPADARARLEEAQRARRRDPYRDLPERATRRVGRQSLDRGDRDRFRRERPDRRRASPAPAARDTPVASGDRRPADDQPKHRQEPFRRHLSKAGCLVSKRRRGGSPPTRVSR